MKEENGFQSVDLHKNTVAHTHTHISKSATKNNYRKLHEVLSMCPIFRNCMF